MLGQPHLSAQRVALLHDRHAMAALRGDTGGLEPGRAAAGDEDPPGDGHGTERPQLDLAAGASVADAADRPSLGHPAPALVARDAVADVVGPSLLRLPRPVRVDDERAAEADEVGLASGEDRLRLLGRLDPAARHDPKPSGLGLDASALLDEGHRRRVTIG